MADLGEEDISWLYVPMDNLGSMSMRERIRDLLGDLDDAVNVSPV
jgi:hypothetical protein